MAWELDALTSSAACTVGQPQILAAIQVWLTWAFRSPRCGPVQAETSRIGRIEESKRVKYLLDRRPGGYHRPAVVVFYIPTALRARVATELDDRFGYRTETIYPDLAGFALANSPSRQLS
jgi:hypothetical protein